jgi:hypothetical protein
MGLEKLKGRGRLVPTLATGLEYQVNYEIHFPILEREPMRRLTPNHMCSSRCFVRSAHHHRIPDGPYFLHVDVGQVHQVQSIAGKVALPCDSLTGEFRPRFRLPGTLLTGKSK